MKTNKFIHFVLVLVFVTSLATISPERGIADMDVGNPPQLAESKTSAISLDSWNIECVDCPQSIGGFNDRSMQLDSNGNPHIAYGNDHLYYAWYDGAAWHNETVDKAPRVGSGASLALDTIGYARISYIDGYRYALKYAFEDSSGWHIETVDLPAPGMNIVYYSDNENTSLVIDTNGFSHIAYMKGCAVNYAWQDISGWHTEYAGTGDCADRVSLALDADGNAHIGFSNNIISGDYRYFIEYLYQGSNGWQVEYIGGGYGITGGPSLVLDVNGIPSISYTTMAEDSSCYFTGSCKVIYAIRGETQWNVQKIEEGGDDYSLGTGSPSLKLDQSGNPHISYYFEPGESSTSGMKYASWNGSAWQIEVIDVSGGPVSLDLDSSGKPAVAYMDGNVLKFASRPGTQWQKQEVAVSRVAGINSSLALSDSGSAKIAYVSSSHWVLGDLKLASQTPTGWNTEDIDGSNINEYGMSMALDSNGYPHISYFGFYYPPGVGLTWKLKYAYQNATGWYTQTIESVGTMDPVSSLALDSNGFVHIAYVREIPSKGPALVYAHQSSSGWITETVSTEPGYGVAALDLALDKDGNPHIAFGNTIVNRDASGWHFQIIAPNPPGTDIISTPSLTLDGDGFEHVSYSDYYPGQWSRLMYAWRNSTGWHYDILSEIITYYNWMPYHSLALDQSGNAHISYYDNNFPSQDLHYAYRDATGWITQTVDTLGDVGTWSSLALDQNSKPHISYYDATNGDLKYAYLGDPPSLGVSLDPAFQTKEGGLGRVVQYPIRILNSTGTTNTFKLSLGTHAWPVTLSTNTVGPLPYGIWGTFTVSVTVPPGATGYSADTVKVTATSVSAPSSYTATTTLTTRANSSKIYLPILRH